MADRCVLDNWKEIAAYLGRTGRTCRNWEKEYGLPVHRLDGSPRAHVFAYPDEIDRWKEEMLREEKKRAGSARDLMWEKELLGQNKVGGLILRLLPRLLRKPLVAIAVIALIAFAVWFFPRRAKIRHAKYELLPKVIQLAEDTNLFSLSGSPQKVYQAAIEAKKFIPGDPTLAEILKIYSTRISVTTDPAGAKVYIKPYQAPEEPWEYLGVSPLESPRLPLEYLRLKIEKEGYETVFAASTSYDFDNKNQAFTANNIFWKLDKLGDIPSGMVRVVGVEDEEAGKIDDFFMDRFEVTNKQYKEFVDKGGYENREFWKNTFVKDGRPMTWEQAMAEFVDVTGRPGPATWQGGSYPEGQDDYPVSGVSWYEAAAYAAFARKSLPTGAHWEMARGVWTPLFKIYGRFSQVFIPQSNLRGMGPDRVGSNPGITAYGLYDMGGNVREWCWNEMEQGRLVRGGAWDEEPYKSAHWSQLPPFDRSAENGFRCAIYINPELIPPSSFAAVKSHGVPDYSKLNPVTDPVFSVYREQFSYDKRDLNARVEWRNEASREWIQERISFDAAYGNERVFAYLFLPTNTTPPFQTVIYFPTISPVGIRTSKNIEKYFEFMPFILRNGRAFLFPVYKGTFERGIEDFGKVLKAKDSYQFSEFIIKVVKDFRRSVDYLETRPDIDRAKLAYLGWNWGAMNGPIITALEDRLKACVLRQGGLKQAWRRKFRPEVDPFNYVSRVKIPTLMLNGRYDTLFPLELSVKPMFQLLGTPPEQKELKVYDTDHTVPDLEFVKETLRWLDKYLGPAK